MIDSGHLNESYSVTLMTTLSEETPIVFDIHQDSNTGFDFLDFIWQYM